MVQTLNGKSEDQMVTAAKAVMDHHFDCHKHCSDWPKQKEQTLEQKEEKKKHCRCKTKDVLLCKELQRRIERFIATEALLEVAYKCDTLCNELFNNVAAWLAPKNKTHGSSHLLKTRIVVAVGWCHCQEREGKTRRHLQDQQGNQ